jgi:hypothetical protein
MYPYVFVAFCIFRISWKITGVAAAGRMRDRGANAAVFDCVRKGNGDCSRKKKSNSRTEILIK